MTELQGRLLTLLKITDELCREYDVDYFLLGGTLIGAMRHKGFIPWDDDADVIMSRDNWNKFYECTKGKLPEGYKISSQDDDINVGMPINRLTETTTTGLFRYHLSAPEVAGTQIDIFIMDPVPDTEEDKEIYRTAIEEYNELCALHASYAYRYGKSSHFIRNWERSLEVGKKQVLDEISAKAFHYTEEESQLYAQRFGGAPHFWPKEVFGKPQYVPFEDTMLPIPARPGDCLTIGYNEDWRFIPRLGGVDHSTHDFAVRSYTTPSTVIWNEYLEHVDNEALVKAYIERKYTWDETFEERFGIETEVQHFYADRVRAKYQNKLKEVDLAGLLAAREYDKLYELFEEYAGAQTNSRLTGSASLTGRIQYYRRNHPLLIDIGDEAIHAAVIALLHKQKLAAAVKVMRARIHADRPLTKELEEDKAAIERIKRVVSTYDCGEYEECSALVKEGLAADPDDPFCKKHSVFLQVRNCKTTDGKIRVLKKGLKELPDEAELLWLLADCYKKKGKIKEAVSIFDKLIASTDDGIVLNHVRDACKELYDADSTEENLARWTDCRRQCGESVGGTQIEDEDEIEGDSDEDADDDEDISYEPLDDIQKCRLELLNELDGICRVNGIRYFLSGNLLWQAVKYGRYVQKYGELTVMMSGEDAVRFQNIVNSSGKPDRRVESMLNNPNFYRIAMRYTNTATLDASVGTFDSVEYPGIAIMIEILRAKESNGLAVRHNRLLEKGWELRTEHGRDTRRDRLIKDYVARMVRRMGDQKTAEYIFKQLTKASVKDAAAKNKECIIRPYRKRRVYLPGECFARTKEAEFEGGTYPIPADAHKVIRVQIGKKWETRNYAPKKINEIVRLIDPDLPCGDYQALLKRDGTDAADFSRRWRDSNAAYRKITKVSKLGTKHWFILEACGIRYNLRDEYRDKKEEIMAAYTDGDVTKVGELTESYFEAVRFYGKKRLAVYFDKDLFEVILWYIRKIDPEDGEVFAQKLIRYQEEQKWAEL